MLTMCPPSRICGRQRRVIRSSPWTSVSSTVSSSSSVDSQKGSRPRPSPALLMRMSRTSSSSLISVSSWSTRRAPPATRAPSRARAAAVAAPMPLEAPVTIAVFPSSPPTIRRRLARGRQQGLAAPKVQLGPLRREERLGLRELGVGLRTATRGGERLGPMQTCDRLGSFRTDSLVDGRSGREVALRYCNACLEPRRRRHGLRLLQVLLLAANVEHEPRQVLDEPLVELGREREELVDELLGLAALSVEQKRPGMDFQPGMQQLGVPDRARELEAALGVGERGAHVALSHEGAARHHQDWADEVVVYVSHLRQELARRAPALLPGA